MRLRDVKDARHEKLRESNLGKRSLQGKLRIDLIRLFAFSRFLEFKAGLSSSPR
jgi:hypothetical protein